MYGGVVRSQIERQESERDLKRETVLTDPREYIARVINTIIS